MASSVNTNPTEQVANTNTTLTEKASPTRTTSLEQAKSADDRIHDLAKSEKITAEKNKLKQKNEAFAKRLNQKSNTGNRPIVTTTVNKVATTPTINITSNKKSEPTATSGILPSETVATTLTNMTSRLLHLPKN